MIIFVDLRTIRTNNRSSRIAASCISTSIFSSGIGALFSGSSEDNGGTETLHARGAAVGGRSEASGSHGAAGGVGARVLTGDGRYSSFIGTRRFVAVVVVVVMCVRSVLLLSTSFVLEAAAVLERVDGFLSGGELVPRPEYARFRELEDTTDSL
jgi:hypothetical protein